MVAERQLREVAVLLDDPGDRAEAAHAALELLRPDLDQAAVDKRAFTELSAGALTGDRAVSLWTEKWRLYLLEQRLRKEIAGGRPGD